MNKTETKTREVKAMTTKQFNLFFDSMVKNGMATEDKRTPLLSKMVSTGEVKIGRGSYTQAQTYIVNKFQDAILTWTKEAEEQGLNGVNKGILTNALGVEIDIALNMKSVKVTK